VITFSTPSAVEGRCGRDIQFPGALHSNCCCLLRPRFKRPGRRQHGRVVQFCKSYEPTTCDWGRRDTTTHDRDGVGGGDKAAQREDGVHQATDSRTGERFHGAQLLDETTEIRDCRCSRPHRATGQTSSCEWRTVYITGWPKKSATIKHHR